MKILYAPWRTIYAQSVNASSKAPNAPAEECIFCSQLSEHDDAKHLILKRFEHTYVMLNKFPYNAGHLLVLPLTHSASLNTVPPTTRAELMELTNASIEILQNILKPEGFNMGINLGIAAGAGIPSHLHMHVLPRWQRDTNFLPTLADTRVISFDLQEIYKKLLPAFTALSI